MPRLFRALLLACLALAAHLAQAQATLRAPMPLLSLAEARSEGARAVELLGDRLPEVAAHYRKSPEEFAALLLADRSLKLDRNGRLFVEEGFRPPPFTNSPLVSADSAVDGTLAPLDQTFLLHSRPGAKRTIYLNFKGATLNGTAWNGSATTVTALPFDLDGLPYSYNTTELQRIQYIWQRVAEDYAPFDVDVTTEAPPADRLTRSSTSDDVYGTTALITSRSGVYSCSCGGVAYIGVFDSVGDYYKPALVFYDALGPGNEKYIAEAISHEVGHNGGLYHDGTASVGYYAGHGSGATGWAPIMGVGYYQPLVQWSKGEYAGANNVQDDFIDMQANGLPLRADDHGNTPGTATRLTGTTSGGLTSYTVEGVIGRAGDVDVFAFASGAGSVSFTVSPAARSANLDAVLELYNGAGTLLASANPVDALNGNLTVVLPSAGTYYVAVRGTGKGDPATNGYTTYGSVGLYAVTGTVPAATGTPPIAVIAATPTSGTVPLTVNFSGTGSTDADGTIVGYAWTFGDGTSAAGAAATKVYGSVGTYTAQLTVTDNSGLTALKTVTITVNPAVTLVPLGVGNIAMSVRNQGNGGRATAVVTVRDNAGRVVPGATVSGTWSGLVTGSASVVTGSTGNATFNSATTRSRGTFIFTVTGITLAGYTYTPALNVETSDSISR